MVNFSFIIKLYNLKTLLKFHYINHTILLFSHQPISRSFQFLIYFYRFLFHLVFHFSIVLCSIFHQANQTTQILISYHLYTILNIYVHQTKQICLGHAFYYFSKILNTNDHQSKYNDQNPQYCCFQTILHIYFHLTKQMFHVLLLNLIGNNPHTGLHPPIFQLHNHVVYHLAIILYMKHHLGEDRLLFHELYHQSIIPHKHLLQNELVDLLHLPYFSATFLSRQIHQAIFVGHSLIFYYQSIDLGKLHYLIVLLGEGYLRCRCLAFGKGQVFYMFTQLFKDSVQVIRKSLWFQFFKYLLKKPDLIVAQRLQMKLYLHFGKSNSYPLFKYYIPLNI